MEFLKTLQCFQLPEGFLVAGFWSAGGIGA